MHLAAITVGRPFQPAYASCKLTEIVIEFDKVLYILLLERRNGIKAFVSVQFISFDKVLSCTEYVRVRPVIAKQGVSVLFSVNFAKYSMKFVAFCKILNQKFTLLCV